TRFFADGVMIALCDEAAKLRGFGKVFKDATGEALAEESRRRHTEQLRTLADVSSRLNAVLDLGSVLGVVTEEGRTLIGAHQAITNIITEGTGTLQSVALSDELRGAATAPFPPDRSAIYRAIYPASSAASKPVRLTQDELRAHAGWPGFHLAAESMPPMRGLLAAPIVARGGDTLGVIQLSDKYDGDFTEEDEAILVQLAQMAAVAVENTQLYQALRDADRRKDEFLAMLAHELRNPLAPMQSALALLDAEGSRSPAAVRLRAVIGRQMSHMTRLVDDLLDVARITSGKVVLKPESVELGRVVALAVETSRPLIDAKRHALTVDAPGPIWLDADPVRLAQVISNLLNNAAKYTDDGGQISVSARREGGDAVIRVRDTGIGLSADMLPRVFELFTQASAGLARSAGGLGIGLTLVRKLVELHGGNVSVSSAGRGEGSEFVVRLPAGTGGASDDAPAETPRPEGPRRVLLVDDNPDALETMSMLLEMFGHEVATASDGVKAVEVARSFRPEVMFLDLGLPGRDGYEVARILREEFPKGTLWLVALTGYGQDEDRRRTHDAGFDQHLVKPVEPEALEAALQRHGR
ncbi:MAG TPA: ATP-binding protein, partial [Nannocystis sp.]